MCSGDQGAHVSQELSSRDAVGGRAPILYNGQEQSDTDAKANQPGDEP